MEHGDEFLKISAKIVPKIILTRVISLQGEHRRRLTTRFILNTFCSWYVTLHSERRTHSPSPSPSSSSSSDSSTGS